VKAVWKDGKTYEGETSDELVLAMLRDHPFTADMGAAMYRRAVAMRAKMYRKTTIRHSDSTVFLIDLATAGYVTVTA
jgi:hypothetical protein